jgi:hypothetical protein
MKVKVSVHPNSKRPRIEKSAAGNLDVYISEPPIEGKANAAVIKVLAKRFSVSKTKVVLVRGDKSKHKIFQIDI